MKKSTKNTFPGKKHLWKKSTKKHFCFLKTLYEDLYVSLPVGLLQMNSGKLECLNQTQMCKYQITNEERMNIAGMLIYSWLSTNPLY